MRLRVKPALTLLFFAAWKMSGRMPCNNEKSALRLRNVEMHRQPFRESMILFSKRKIYAKSRPFSISVRFQANDSVGLLREWHVSAKRGFVPRGLLAFG
jgi:hypothetical protein